ncbi:DUF3798 domain-containing protein [Vallitalea okinawensis]|uniref:DUF3798 domain-containing protein n=1 Tax=Vallitalea okinawensis TaxID=2078660 RepID=UPI000CFA8D09|nr:DUF3798 domain-containing protein [Vallitalea okinawensis]
MLKKGLSLMIVLIMLTTMLMACNSTETSSGEDNWKIGVITGTVTQNEEEYRAAEAVLAKYGEEHVILQTYPDNFMDEQETVISNITGVASDPDVKALVICQGIPGTSAAIDKVKELRGDDLLIIVGTSGEDPNMISERADICFQMDEIGMGTAVPEQAKKLGAEVFVHYSFPRHMSYALLAARRDLMKEKCDELGIEFVDATAPDPTGDAGTAGAQQFILEDVPKMIEQYGKNTAFFSTNCAMQTPLIKASFDEGAIYPQPCCPSPYHGFPNALEITVEGHEGDIPYILNEISNIYAEAGISGRASTWPVPVNMMYVEAGADYAVKWINGEFEEKLNVEEVIKSFNVYVESVTKTDEIKLNVVPLVENDKEFDNYLMVLCDFYDF